MTNKEKAIVMAYTGVTTLAGDKLSVFYDYLKGLLGRPVYTHELANIEIQKEIEKKSKQDFVNLCAEEPKKIKVFVERTSDFTENGKIKEYVSMQEAIDDLLKNGNFHELYPQIIISYPDKTCKYPVGEPFDYVIEIYDDWRE